MNIEYTAGISRASNWWQSNLPGKNRVQKERLSFRHPALCPAQLRTAPRNSGGTAATRNSGRPAADAEPNASGHEGARRQAGRHEAGRRGRERAEDAGKTARPRQGAGLLPLLARAYL